MAVPALDPSSALEMLDAERGPARFISHKMKLLTKQEVKECLPMARAIDLMASAFAALTRGTIESPLRTCLESPAGRVLYKPAYSPDHGLFAAKVVSVFPGNAGTPLPVTQAAILVNDVHTGSPLALMDGTFLTSLRTGAATGLATRLFAPEQVAEAALFGTGGQAFHQLEAMLAVRDIQVVHVFSSRPENARAFCERHAGDFPSCSLRVAESLRVLGRCALVTTATTSPGPVFEDADLPREVHVNAIGSFGRDRTEIPLQTLLRSRLVVDQRAACLEEAGEILSVLASGFPAAELEMIELGELGGRSGLHEPGTSSVFKSVGNAAQDIVCAAEVLRVSSERGLGVTFEL